ncbi:MAG: ATP-binding protein [Oscillospiraceae bacterium]|nr:ATP-binding protein [Oscillospiraceae bacterium]MCL2278486.1 ATP-binding protein [Oscillospiraceae bacterium]
MIKRELYMEQIRPFIGKDVVKVITGIRRSGKSVLLELLRAEINEFSQSIYLNFESKKNAEYTNADALYSYVVNRVGESKAKWYLFFDEIQEVTNWESVINSFRVDFDADIYITGSNAKLLSGELATLIAGRYVQFTVYPLSYDEFLKLNKGKGFSDYLRLGGMPFINNIINDEGAINIYLEDLYNSIVLKDVVKRNNIRDVDLLDRIVTYVLANISKTFSATSISKYFKNEHRRVSTDTVLNYIKACEEAYLFYKLKRQDIIGKKILKVSEKYFVADHGLREVVYGKQVQDISAILENIICLELLRRGYKVTVGAVYDEEIDFVGVKNSESIYIQVTYLMADEITRNREFRSLLRIEDNYPKYVVSMDEVNFSQKGIVHANIKDFLLSEW